MCAEKDISPEVSAHGHDTYTQMAAFSFEEEEKVLQALSYCVWEILQAKC